MIHPLISVIIAVYNGESTIAKAIESVLGQSYRAHELIVVDDGSTDETAKVVQGYGERVKYLHQRNAGVSAARNAGVSAASGDWLAFLDADDWYYPDRLLWHADWIARDSRLDFLTGDYEYAAEDGSVIGRSMESKTAGQVMLAKANGKREVVMEFTEFADFIADHFGDTHTLSVPRRRFLDLGGYPVGYKVCEDVHFLTRLCASSRRVGVVCEPMGAYAIHDRSATRTNRLQSQFQNVETLVALKPLASGFPREVREGFHRRLAQGRLNKAYALAKAGRRIEAISAVLPLLREAPATKSLRALLSILRG